MFCIKGCLVSCLGRKTAGQRAEHLSLCQLQRSTQTSQEPGKTSLPLLPETSLTLSSPTTVPATLYRNPLPMGLLRFCPLQTYHGKLHSAFPPGWPTHRLQPFRKANPQKLSMPSACSTRLSVDRGEPLYHRLLMQLASPPFPPPNPWHTRALNTPPTGMLKRLSSWTRNHWNTALDAAPTVTFSYMNQFNN